MDKARASHLFESGRSHALAADLLYRAALAEGVANGVKDPADYAFNGSYSLSTFYLLGLGLELMLKAAIVAHDGPSDERSMREIGHDLVIALDRAETAGFHSNAPRLRDLVEVMNEPFKLHWFRYARPANMPLPGDFNQVVETLQCLDEELQAILWVE